MLHPSPDRHLPRGDFLMIKVTGRTKVKCLPRHCRKYQSYVCIVYINQGVSTFEFLVYFSVCRFTQR